MAYRTRQRDAIWQVVATSERPLTAQDICEEAGKSVEGIGIATVYRALKQMVDEGQVRHIEVPGVQPHYENAARSHHHFFLCEQCKRLFDLAGCLRGISNLLPSGYRMKRHEIVIYGDCDGCVTRA
jgi:Fur family transcriptional regulator, ferric uptake regulator